MLVPCFYDDPLFRWGFSDLTDEQRHQKLWSFFKPTVRSAPTAGGFLLDAKDWGAVMAVACPGQKFDGVANILKCGGVPGVAKCGLKPAYVSPLNSLPFDQISQGTRDTYTSWAKKRILVEYATAVEKVKHKVIPTSRYDCFYIIITATAPEQRKQGLNSAMIREVMERARKVDKPIWLEATTAYSRRQYERVGFEVVGEITVGKGKVDKDGRNERGGEGVTVTGMVWWPEKSSRSGGKGKEVASVAIVVEQQREPGVDRGVEEGEGTEKVVVETK